MLLKVKLREMLVYVLFVMVLFNMRRRVQNTLKRFKDDAKEVAKGYECGITMKTTMTLKKAMLFQHLKWLKLSVN